MCTSHQGNFLEKYSHILRKRAHFSCEFFYKDAGWLKTNVLGVKRILWFVNLVFLKVWPVCVRPGRKHYAPVFVSTDPLGQGNSGTFNFSVFKTLLKARLCGVRFVVKPLLIVPETTDNNVEQQLRIVLMNKYKRGE